MPEDYSPITPENLDRLSEVLTIDHSRAANLAWSPDSKMLAVGDWSNAGWSLREAERFPEEPSSVWLFAIDAASPEKPLQQLDGHERVVGGLAFSPDGRTLVSSDRAGAIRFWDVETGRVQRTLGVPGYSTFNLSFSPDGTFLAAAGSENESDPWGGSGVLAVWDLKTGTRIILIEHDSWVGDALFNSGGDLLAYFTVDWSVHLMDLVTKQEIGFLPGEEGPAVVGMAFTPDGLFLFPGDDYGSSFRMWNWRTGENRMLASLQYTGRFIPAFHPTVRLVAVIESGAHNWDEVHILDWSPEGKGTSKPLRVLDAGEALMGGLAFSPDGRFLAVADQRAIRLFGIGQSTEQKC